MVEKLLTRDLKQVKRVFVTDNHDIEGKVADQRTPRPSEIL